MNDDGNYHLKSAVRHPSPHFATAEPGYYFDAWVAQIESREFRRPKVEDYMPKWREKSSLTLTFEMAVQSISLAIEALVDGRKPSRQNGLRGTGPV